MMMTRLPFRKVHEIVGATNDGSVWCLRHAEDVKVEDIDTGQDVPVLEYEPVFLDEADEMYCDVCGEPLDA